MFYVASAIDGALRITSDSMQTNALHQHFTVLCTCCAAPSSQATTNDRNGLISDFYMWHIVPPTM